MQHVNALVEGAIHDFVLLDVETLYGLFQVTHATVNNFGGCARGSTGEVSAVEQHGFQAAQLRIERATCSGGASADYADVESLFRDDL
jgi:hypothetical protein